MTKIFPSQIAMQKQDLKKGHHHLMPRDVDDKKKDPT